MLTVDTSNVKIQTIRKGYEGVVATEDISAGDIIFVEDITVLENVNNKEVKHIPPCVRLAVRIVDEGRLNNLIDNGFKANLWTKKPSKEDKGWLNTAIDAREVSRRAVMDAYNIAAAYNIHASDALDSCNEDEILVNERLFIGMYVSKVNHSCSPNARLIQISDEETLRQRVTGMFALKNIKRGEQITHSYLPNMDDDEFEIYQANRPAKGNAPLSSAEQLALGARLGRKDRRRLLKSHFLFDCNCNRCKSEQ